MWSSCTTCVSVADLREVPLAGHLERRPRRSAPDAQLGLKVREAPGGPQAIPRIPGGVQADAELFPNVRNVFGGRLLPGDQRRAPIAEGDSSSSTRAACQCSRATGSPRPRPRRPGPRSRLQFGTVGRPLPGSEVRIADDGEILVKGPNIFDGYYKIEDKSFGAIEDGWLHTGDLGSIDEDGFLSITGRKKDIIITAGGKNLTPANLENDLKQSRWISQAVMHGDRRPYPVALHHARPRGDRAVGKEQGLPEYGAALAAGAEGARADRGRARRGQRKYARKERIKGFVILDHDLSLETGD